MPKKRKAAAGWVPLSKEELAQAEQTIAVPVEGSPLNTGRPVIAGRVSRQTYDRIKAAAAASGRSMAEELAWQAEQSIAWEKAHGTISSLMDNARRIAESNAEAALEAALRRQGFLPVRLHPQGKAWISPDADRGHLNLVVDVDRLAADLLPSLKAGLHEALGGLAKKRGKK